MFTHMSTDQLPPLQTLRAFEATGRRLSMTLAAQELHLTHGAVSRQIKALEDHLGVPLFRRLTRRIELTDAGQAFFSTVTRLLSELAREAEELRRRSDTSRLIVNCSVSFASKWLTQRLHRLIASSPDLDIHLEVTDAPVDFATSHVDVALRYGDEDYTFAASERYHERNGLAGVFPRLSRQDGRACSHGRTDQMSAHPRNRHEHDIGELVCNDGTAVPWRARPRI